MKKSKNKELTHKEQQLKLNKKNYLIIIIPIVLIVICILGIALYTFHFSNPSVKMKKYLEEANYICNKSNCSIEKEGIIHNFNYKELYLLTETDNYILTISEKYPVLELKNEEFICSYEQQDYKIFTLVDESFSYNRKCGKYIEDVNKSIQIYEKVINESEIDVNNFEK